MVDVELAFGVPEGIVAEVKKKYSNEKDNNIRVTKANPLNPPYYAWGDPRSKYEVLKFEGKDFWIWKVSKGKAMNWVYDH